MMVSVSAALTGGVGQQLQQRRLVGDECADALGMAGDQRQPGHRPAAGPEHIGRVGAEVVEDRDDVVGARLGRRLLLRIVDRAVGESARVVGDDGVVGRERVGQRCELRRHHRRADDEQQRAGQPRTS